MKSTGEIEIQKQHLKKVDSLLKIKLLKIKQSYRCPSTIKRQGLSWHSSSSLKRSWMDKKQARRQSALDNRFAIGKNSHPKKRRTLFAKQ
ncbi:MAG: hypothetical protein II943_03950 [Victivallales bacterium]|nr:hypothetical protein [Victivallales bacterium]